LVLGLAALAARLLRGFGGRFTVPTAGYSIISRARLDGRRTLYQIRRGDRNILLLAGGGADIVLDQWDDGPERGA
jgi:hypothetical protein